MAQAQEVLYSWQSPSGMVAEHGGTLSHINQNGRDLRNILCGGVYTFVLNGDYRYADAGYNVDECSYMRLVLDGDRTLHAGDEIEVTAMRNNVVDRPASICFLFHVEANGSSRNVRLLDTHVWNNLRQGHDSNLGGGTERSASRTAAAFTPSTYTFVVPPEADGATYVRLTRSQPGNLLYVSRLVVTRPEPSGITTPTAPSRNKTLARKYVKDGRLMISRHGRLYRADGTLVPAE